MVVYATFYTKGKNWQDEYKMHPGSLKESLLPVTGGPVTALVLTGRSAQLSQALEPGHNKEVDIAQMQARSTVP